MTASLKLCLRKKIICQTERLLVKWWGDIIHGLSVSDKRSITYRFRTEEDVYE